MEDLKAKIRPYILKIRQHRLPVLLFTVGFTLLLGIFAYNSPYFYQSHASFHPENSSNDGAAALSGNPLSLLLGAGGADVFETGMMEVVLKSRRISEQVVKDSIFIEGEKHLLADLVIDRFPKSSSPIAIFNRLIWGGTPKELNKKIIRAGKIVKGGLMVEKTETGFINMDLTYPDSMLTRILSHRYIDKLSKYYVGKKTEKAINNRDFFIERADSVKRVLDSTAVAYGRFQDQNKNLIRLTKATRGKELEVKLTYLQEMYAALISNREQAVSQLQRDTPIIQVLDGPDPPYTVITRKVWVYSLIGLVLGLILAISWTCRHLLRAEFMNYINHSAKNTEEE